MSQFVMCYHVPVCVLYLVVKCQISAVEALCGHVSVPAQSCRRMSSCFVAKCLDVGWRENVQSNLAHVFSQIRAFKMLFHMGSIHIVQIWEHLLFPDREHLFSQIRSM